MFKKESTAERTAWLQTKQLGKARFIRGEMRYSFVLWLMLMTALDLVINRQSHSSVSTTIFVNLVALPICLLGGYLNGHWKWADLEKKYPEGSLPPWE
jgi:hypothetical protein